MTAAVVGPEAAPAPEAEVISDMLRRGAPALPVLAGLAGLGWGWDGAASAGVAIGLVVVNFVLTAVILSVSGRHSVTGLMAGTLVGYLVRMVLVVAVLFVVKDWSWIELTPLGITLVVTHLGLLFSEMRHVSASLAFPGVKPSARPVATSTTRSAEEADPS
ncbi:MAG TPA: ATP synthase subunit I [Iamia sp.]|nr:ATP synthase subunit I [Iamia sp.]